MKRGSEKEEGGVSMCTGCCGSNSCTCYSWQVFGALLWAAGAISLAAAWVAAKGTGGVLGYDAGFWFGSAMAFGILAVPLKLKRCGGAGCGEN